MENNMKTRDGFSSRLGIIAAAAGSAIGLGNIWKFPYITGKYGGAAFILVYLVCIALIGLPVMLSEFLIGRRAQKNTVGAYKAVAPGTPWFFTGWIGLLTAFFILSFYGVVAGWTLAYVFKAITNSFAGMSPDDIGNAFGGLITSVWQPIGWQVAFMILTAGVVLGGIKDGIERYSKILMPLLLLIIIVLDIRAVTLPGAGAGVSFLLSPDFSKLSAEAILSALGHAFFSLSLGMGTMITYGSYIGKKENLGTTAMQVTIADTLIALLAGLAIFPAVFAFNIDPTQGPGLVFVTLPNVFNQMPGGYFFAILFFSLLAVAALTSSISILEVVVAYFDEEHGMNRKLSTLIATVAITLFGSFLSLTYAPDALGEVMWVFPNMGEMQIMDWFITLTDQLLPLGGLLISLFIGWGMKWKDVEEECHTGDTSAARYLPAFKFLIKYVAPIMILLTLLNGLGLLPFIK